MNWVSEKVFTCPNGKSVLCGNDADWRKDYGRKIRAFSG